MSLPHEDLSRLLSGDLSEAEAEALRERIAAEPETAAAWSSMQGLPELLSGGLETPPASLDRELLARLSGEGGGASAGPRPLGSGRAWVPWATAALAALLAVALLLRAPPTPTVFASAGEQWIEGRADLLVGDLRVAVDGVASIFVEPAEPRPRARGQEAEPMNPAHLAAALAGALVTVAVYEGSARLSTGDSEPAIELAAGEHLSVRSPSSAPRGQVAPTRRIVAPRPDRETAVEPDDPKDAEIAMLRDRLARLELASSLDRGRIEALEGVPQPWPEDLPEPFLAPNFEAALRGSLADLGGELAAVDCSEFPCLAVLRSDLPEAEWKAWMESVGARLEEVGLGGERDLGLGLFAHQSQGPEGDVRLLGLAVTPHREEGERDPDAAARTQHRMTEQLGGLEDELRAAGDEE